MKVPIIIMLSCNCNYYKFYRFLINKLMGYSKIIIFMPKHSVCCKTDEWETWETVVKTYVSLVLNF